MHGECGNCVCALHAHRFYVLESVMHGVHTWESSKVRLGVGVILELAETRIVGGMWPRAGPAAFSVRKQSQLLKTGNEGRTVTCHRCRGHARSQNPDGLHHGEWEKQGSWVKKMTCLFLSGWFTSMDDSPNRTWDAERWSKLGIRGNFQNQTIS